MITIKKSNFKCLTGIGNTYWKNLPVMPVLVVVRIWCTLPQNMLQAMKMAHQNYLKRKEPVAVEQRQQQTL